MNSATVLWTIEVPMWPGMTRLTATRGASIRSPLKGAAVNPSR